MPAATVLKNYKTGEAYGAYSLEDLVGETGEPLHVLEVIDKVSVALEQKGKLPVGEFVVARFNRDLPEVEKLAINENSVLSQ